jgi:hypothetical protein
MPWRWWFSMGFRSVALPLIRSKAGGLSEERVKAFTVDESSKWDFPHGGGDRRITSRLFVCLFIARNARIELLPVFAS